MKIRIIVSLVIILSFTVYSQAQVVCSLDELIKELYEDLIDNGKLDCLRKSVSPNEADESEEQRKRRIQANWDGDCSFEAEGKGNSDWFVKLMNNYELKKGLVDVNGEPVEKDFDDQADMCEIVRALIANGKVPAVGEDVKSIPLDVLDYIDCPGSESQTQVCAATGGSFAEKSKWYVLLDGKSITLNKEPKYIIAKNPKS